jgi:hypothetical protein
VRPDLRVLQSLTSDRLEMPRLERLQANPIPCENDGLDEHAHVVARSCPTVTQRGPSRNATSRWRVAAAPSVAKKVGRLASWSALPWIAWDADLASMPFARWLPRHVPRADVALRTSHFGSQLVAGESGLGPALEASAADLPSDDVWLVGHRALRDVPRIDAVWRFILDEMKRLAGKKRR